MIVIYPVAGLTAWLDRNGSIMADDLRRGRAPT